MNNTGLNNEEVIKSRKKHGNNSIKLSKQNKFIDLLVESLGDPIIKILLIALAIKVIFLFKDFDFFETIGIVVAIFTATFISSLSEYGSEKAFSKMQEEAGKIKCKVRRNNILEEISIDDVVVGDIVILESGDMIPADGYIIEGKISVDESSLTGESKEVYKEKVINIPSDKNRVYRGCTVYSNEALMKVEKVGLDTMYGSISKELTEKTSDSPLKIRLANLAKVISKIGYVSAFLASISYLFSVFVISNNFDLELIKESIVNTPFLLKHLIYALTLCVTIIVVAVPEGLPMMITLVLSSNMKKMVKDNVLVRKLVGIETSGSLNILFTDKTGTLTKGNLEVNKVLLGNLKEFNEEFEMYNYRKYYDIFKKSIIINNSSSYSEINNKIIGGNITDRALLSYIKTGTSINIDKIKTIPFDSKNKYSIVTIDNNKSKLNLIKGAPEKLLNGCKQYYDENGNKKLLLNKDKISREIDKMTKNGIRAVLLATSNNFELTNFSNLCLVGIVFLKDEIRKEAKEGVELVKSAGISTVMITGDNKDTAESIAKELGIISSKDDIVITSDELNNMTDDEIIKIMNNLKVVARSLPTDKSKLIKIAKEMGLVVGMTGDGVNDAPALKKADVGFSMGSGSEVAKEASDIVILDNNFLSISKAILYGRTIFKSIRKFIIIQLTINLCAIFLSLICPFIGVDTPITVIQMLWVNMVMDTLAGLAFAFEPPLIEYMNEKPKKKNESIINKYMISEILITGIYSTLLCLFFLKSPVVSSLFRGNPVYLMSAFFGLFIFIDIFNSFNARTSRINIFSNILDNKMFIIIMLFITFIQVLLIYFGGNLFRTTSLTFKEFIIMLAFALTVIPVDSIRKVIFKKLVNDQGV